MSDKDTVVASSERAMAVGSKSFGAAAALFDRQMREDVWQLYAWCRHCDDEIDGQTLGHGFAHTPPAELADRLARLQQLTGEALSGESLTHVAFIGFQRVALRHRIARQWPSALLDGLAMDVRHSPYDTDAQLLDYCFCVAGAVGVMMAMIMGVREREPLQRAQDLGIAFQLTNIARDVVEDARRGRVYLPVERLRRVDLGAEPSALIDEANAAAVYRVACELLELADAYYESARVGLRFLPFRAALAVAAARGIYREIGRRLVRVGPDALAARTRVTAARRRWLLLRAVATATWSRFERRERTPLRGTLWSRV